MEVLERVLYFRVQVNNVRYSAVIRNPVPIHFTYLYFLLPRRVGKWRLETLLFTVDDCTLHSALGTLSVSYYLDGLVVGDFRLYCVYRRRALQRESS